MTNEEVLKRVRSVLEIVLYKKHKWIGYILRHEGFLRDIIEGKMMGKATCGRKRITLLNDMAKQRSYAQLKEATLDRVTWKQKQRE